MAWLDSRDSVTLFLYATHNSNFSPLIVDDSSLSDAITAFSDGYGFDPAPIAAAFPDHATYAAAPHPEIPQPIR